MKKQRAAVKRTALSILCILLAVILTGMLGATAYFQHLMNKINFVEPETTPQLSQQELDQLMQQEQSLSTDPELDPEDVEFQDHDLQIGGDDSPLINILLIGQDRRPGEERARSDSMILCTFNKEDKTITLTSVMRDLYVEIPGYQSNRINAAYAAGGMPLLNKTLEHNFGIQVDGNVEVDFGQFSQIIDLLGGVSIELRADEARTINSEVSGNLQAGLQTLNGQQALTYARIRKLDPDADFSRTNRQRKLLTALMDAYRGSSLTTLMSLVDEVLPLITTDIPQTELLSYAASLLPMLADSTIISQRIPVDGMYQGRSIRGMSVLVADMEKTRAFLAETLTKN